LLEAFLLEDFFDLQVPDLEGVLETAAAEAVCEAITEGKESSEEEAFAEMMVAIFGPGGPPALV
jgi:hypothetical protein